MTDSTTYIDIDHSINQLKIDFKKKDQYISLPEYINLNSNKFRDIFNNIINVLVNNFSLVIKEIITSLGNGALRLILAFLILQFTLMKSVIIKKLRMAMKILFF